MSARPYGIELADRGSDLEQEADRAAERVLRMPGPAHAPRVTATPDDDHRLRRKPVSADAAPTGVPSIVHDVLRSPGQPLVPAVRAFMEPRFGQDFGHVRIHTDERAAESADAVNAHAYTVGRNIVFGATGYDPSSQAGRRLLAHELAHVVQAGATPAPARGVLRRQERPAERCPPRPAGEIARSRAPGGILPNDVLPGTNMIDVQDFPVASDTLPAGVTSDPEWERAMSILAGDRSLDAQLLGFTDCVGTQAENLSLRRSRIQSVLAAMPPTARARVAPFVLAMTGALTNTTSYLDTNLTPEGRAHNRSVRIRWVSTPPRGRQACDLITGAAANLDEYIFLITCVESRLGLTAPANTNTVLSVVRQIYFGSGTWSQSRNFVWDNVITAPPWSPGTDPTPRLGPTLMNALRASTNVEGFDPSHIFTGIDAMLNPQLVNITRIPAGFGQTNVPNEDWATWAGDIGSAAAEWVVEKTYTAPSAAVQPNLATFFNRFAGDEDLRGDIAAFAIRRAFNPSGPVTGQLGLPLRLTGPLSNALRQYFRITSSPLGRARPRAVQNFVEAFGGVVSGGRITNPAVLRAALRPSTEEFAGKFMIFKLLQRGYFAGSTSPPGPMPSTILPGAIDGVLDLFMDWLQRNL